MELGLLKQNREYLKLVLGFTVKEDSTYLLRLNLERAIEQINKLIGELV